MFAAKLFHAFRRQPYHRFRGQFGYRKLLNYKGFPGMSTPVFTVSVCTTVKNKGEKLRYYKRS